VARRLKPRADRTAVVVAREVVELPLERGASPVSPKRPELYFCRDMRGYGWLFRKGAYVNLGLGRTDPADIHGHVDRFVAWLRDAGRLPADLDGRWRGHAYRLRERPPRHLTAPGALLVGDAAGLAYPESGERIRTAVESARLAADLIATLDGDYAAERLAACPRRLDERFGEARLTRTPPGAVTAAVARGLLGSAWSPATSFSNRWFLHREQPPLAAPEAPAVLEAAGR
jgi:flavin-dependent dehydrogenase